MAKTFHKYLLEVLADVSRAVVVDHTLMEQEQFALVLGTAFDCC